MYELKDAEHQILKSKHFTWNIEINTGIYTFTYKNNNRVIDNKHIISNTCTTFWTWIESFELKK